MTWSVENLTFIRLQQKQQQIKTRYIKSKLWIEKKWFRSMCCSMFWDGMTGRQCDILSHSPAHRQRDSPLLTVVTRTMKTSYKYRTQYSTVHYSLIKDKSTKTFAFFSVPNSVTIHHLHHCHCIHDRINTSNSIKISTKISILISVNTNAKKNWLVWLSTSIWSNS